MPEFDRSTHVTRGVGRRALLWASATGVAAAAGCLDVLPGERDPQERTFDVAITTADDELVGTVEGADVEDVVQVYVGDTAVFTFANRTDEPVGVHDHASDADVAIDPGGEQTLEFEVTEAMIGRQEVEAWFADETDRREGDGHGADATAIVIVEVRPRGS